jgi:hypothetical protein
MYMTRHPENPQAIHYDPNTGRVVYRAHRRHAGRKTDRIEMPAVEFIAALAQHIPHFRKHQIRYYGACNARVRKRLEIDAQSTPKLKIPKPRYRGPPVQSDWARLICTQGTASREGLRDQSIGMSQVWRAAAAGCHRHQ